MTTPLHQLKAEFFKTLSHPLRIRVLELLSERERSVGELLREIDVEASNLLPAAGRSAPGWSRRQPTGGLGGALCAGQLADRGTDGGGPLDPDQSADRAAGHVEDVARRRAYRATRPRPPRRPVSLLGMIRRIGRVAEAALPPPAEGPGQPLGETSAETGFRGSIQVRHVDAGSCNGCEIEVASAFGPFYDLERYGVRLVASPRHADVLLVTGPVTHNMRDPLVKAYEAMPAPKRVVALGDCAGNDL